MLEITLTIDFGPVHRQPLETIVIVSGRATVFEVLVEAVPVTTSARYGMDCFVEEIDGVKNDLAAERGWCFEINGRGSDVPAERYLVKKGDWIRWHYSDASRA